MMIMTWITQRNFFSDGYILGKIGPIIGRAKLEFPVAQKLGITKMKDR